MKKVVSTLILARFLSTLSLGCPNFGRVSGCVVCQPWPGFYMPVGRSAVTLRADHVNRTALTNVFGYYRFDQVPACGNLYSVSAWAKAFEFEPSVWSFALPVPDLGSDIEIDFVATWYKNALGSFVLN